ncbi:MAG: hypothetical protein AAF478_09080 [Pseudomonadota bacterium]
MGHGGNLGGLFDYSDDLAFDTLQEKNIRSISGSSKISDQERADIQRIASTRFDTKGHNAKQPNDDIPAGYTYLAQFLTHDLTFSGGGLLAPGPSTFNDARTTAMDLDSLFGGGPEISPILYNICGESVSAQAYRTRLRTGRTIASDEKPSLENDIPRACLNDPLTNFSCPKTMGSYPFPKNMGTTYTEPLVADIRNADNLILQQLVVFFIKLQNEVVSRIDRKKLPKDILFRASRNICTILYRSIIINDLLFRLLNPVIYKTFFGLGYSASELARPCGAKFPLFSSPHIFRSAAMRLGHSMIQQRYVFNTDFPEPSLDALLDFSASVNIGFKIPIESSWVIDWDLFFPKQKNYTGYKDKIFNVYQNTNYNKSKKFTFSYAKSLGSERFGPPKDTEQSWDRGLIFADLFRGTKNRLPKTSKLHELIKEDSGIDIQLLETTLAKDNDSENHLIVYFLKEAAYFGGKRLGPLSSYVIANQISNSLTPLNLVDSELQFVQSFGKNGLPIWMPELMECM